MDLPEPVPPLLPQPASSLTRNVDSQPLSTTSNETLGFALLWTRFKATYVFLFASLLGFLSTLSLKRTDGQDTYTWVTETLVSMILTFAYGTPSRVEEGPICDADGCTVWRIPLGPLLDRWRKSMTMATIVLSSNMSLLLLQNVHMPTFAGICATASMMLAIGSYITSHNLLLAYSGIDSRPPSVTIALSTRQGFLACLFSLPSMMSFLSFVSLLGGMAHLLFDPATVLTSRVGLLGLCILVVNVLLASQIRPFSPPRNTVFCGVANNSCITHPEIVMDLPSRPESIFHASQYVFLSHSQPSLSPLWASNTLEPCNDEDQDRGTRQCQLHDIPISRWNPPPIFLGGEDTIPYHHTKTPNFEMRRDDDLSQYLDSWGVGNHDVSESQSNLIATDIDIEPGGSIFSSSDREFLNRLLGMDHR